MTTISIELITKDDTRINGCLSSLLSQTMRDFKVTVVDSSKNSPIRMGGLDSRFTVVQQRSLFLEARALAHQRSDGKFCLLLDSTRHLEPDCLEQCVSQIGPSDMLVLREDSMRSGALSNLVARERAVMLEGVLGLGRLNPSTGSLVPRFYRKELLDAALESVRQHVAPDLFRRIHALEDRMIYFEAAQLSDRVAISASPLLTHIEDDSYSAVWKKYVNYGRGNRLVRDRLPRYRGVASIKSKVRLPGMRPSNGLVYVITLSALRGIPFLFGFFGGSSE